MIRIVHIARPVAGVGIYINLLVKHLDDKKFNNFIISNKKARTFEIKNKSNEKIPEFDVDLLREISLIKDIKCLNQILKCLKKIEPDIIHCHSAKAGFLGRIAGAYLKIPTVYTPHAYSYLSAEGKFKKFLFKNIEKTFRFLPSKTLTCSMSEYNRAVNELKIKKEKVYVWNNSIESNIMFQSTQILNQLPEIFICSIGRPSYQKNTELLVNTIIEVKKSIKNIHLIILGAGLYSPSLENIENLIKKNKLEENITLIPWLERAEIMTILKNCKLYVSTSRYEGLPYAVIEALALSKPCIVTNVDGNKDLIKNNINGFLVNDNAKTIALRIVELLNNEQLLEQLSTNARKSYDENYNISKNIKLLEEAYLSVLN